MVTLDDFDRILRDGLDRADLGKFVMEIGYLTVEALLLWLAAQAEEDGSSEPGSPSYSLGFHP